MDIYAVHFTSMEMEMINNRGIRMFGSFIFTSFLISHVLILH